MISFLNVTVSRMLPGVNGLILNSLFVYSASHVPFLRNEQLVV